MIRVLIAGLMFTTSVEAAMVMPFSVEEMTKGAEKIFVGTCVGAERSVNDQEIPVLTVTFAVTEAIKGEVGETVTFRQLDPTPQQQTDLAPQQAGHFRVISPWFAASLAGVPTYAPGEEVMLFLASEGKLGLTAPIGLFQGKLPVTATASGEKLITNSALKKTELTTVSLPEPGKAGSYDQFVTAIRAIVQSAQQ